MLDKSLVYKDIVMCLPFEDLEDLKVPVLPDGYSYKMFESGDEIALVCDGEDEHEALRELVAYVESGLGE